MRVRRLRRRDNLFRARSRFGVGDVLGDAHREEHRILRHDRELPAQVLELVVPEVDPVEPDLTARRVVEPRQEAHQRALAGAGGARDPQARAGLDVERDVVQHRTIFAVGEGDVVEHDAAAGSREGPGIRSLFDIRWLIEQGEGTLGARQVQLHARRLPADRLQGLVELVEVTHHHEQLAQYEHAGPDLADADEERGRHTSRSGHSNKEVESAFHPGQAHPSPQALPGSEDEALLFSRFLPERLDDAQHAEDLLHDRQG